MGCFVQGFGDDFVAAPTPFQTFYQRGNRIIPQAFQIYSKPLAEIGGAPRVDSLKNPARVRPVSSPQSHPPETQSRPSSWAGFWLDAFSSVQTS
jgi:hypothetical protein